MEAGSRSRSWHLSPVHAASHSQAPAVHLPLSWQSELLEHLNGPGGGGVGGGAGGGGQGSLRHPEAIRAWWCGSQ